MRSCSRPHQRSKQNAMNRSSFSPSISADQLHTKYTPSNHFGRRLEHDLVQGVRDSPGHAAAMNTEAKNQQTIDRSLWDHRRGKSLPSPMLSAEACEKPETAPAVPKAQKLPKPRRRVASRAT
jgi:hypothetical protein